MFRLAVHAVVVSLASACGAAPASRTTPVIEFTIVPEAAPGGPDRLLPVAGRVRGARSDQRVVLFAKNVVWWVQPFRSRPFTTIAADSTWKSDIHLGTEYAALLVDAEFRPPATTETLPAIGDHVAAVLVVKGTGSFVAANPKTITFSGYDWEIRQTPTDRHGRNDFDARNVSVDDRGRLHLSLSRREQGWTSAEIQLTRSLGYGTYEVVVADTSQLDPAAVFGITTYDENTSEGNHREMDIEVSRWGDARNKSVQFVLQPQYVASNVFRFAAPAGQLTHSLRWSSGRASFMTSTASARGSIVDQREFTAGVPVPGNERLHLNLVYYRDAPQPPARDVVEVIVEKFVYLP